MDKQEITLLQIDLNSIISYENTYNSHRLQSQMTTINKRKPIRITPYLFKKLVFIRMR